MIELFTADTPNGKKITIMLEEIGCDFKITKIDLSKDEQFKKDFKKISEKLIDKSILESITFHPVDNIAQVLKLVFV